MRTSPPSKNQHTQASTQGIGKHVLLRIPDITLGAKHGNAGIGICVICNAPFKQFIQSGKRYDRENWKQKEQPARVDEFPALQNFGNRVGE